MRAKAVRGAIAGLVGLFSLTASFYGLRATSEARAAGEALLKGAVGKGCLKMALFFGIQQEGGVGRYFLNGSEGLLTEAVRAGRGLAEWASLLFAARILQGRIGAGKEALRATVIFLPPDHALRELQEAVEVGNLEGIQMAGHRLPLDEWERLLIVGAATMACDGQEWRRVAWINIKQASQLVAGEVWGLLGLALAGLLFLLFGIGAYIHPAMRRRLGGVRERRICGPFEGLELLGWWLGFVLLFQNLAVNLGALLAYRYGAGGAFPGLAALMLLLGQIMVALAVAGVIHLQAVIKRGTSVREAFEEAGLGPPVGLKTGLLAYSLILPAYAASVGLTYLLLRGEAVSWNPLIQLVIMAEEAGEIIPLAIFLCVAIPFVEELVFRGWLFGGLRARFSFWLAAVASAAIFSFIHFDFPLTLPLFAIGLALAFTYEATGSLWGNIIAHGMHNAVTIAALRLLAG